MKAVVQASSLSDAVRLVNENTALAAVVELPANGQRGAQCHIVVSEKFRENVALVTGWTNRQLQPGPCFYAKISLKEARARLGNID